MNEYVKSGTYVRGDVEFPFNYNTSLSASQKVSFVKNVIDVAVGDNYYDFLVDLMFDFEIIDKFTDVDLFDVSESLDQLSAIESFLKDTDIVEVVLNDIEPGLIDELRTSVDRCVEYRTGVHENAIEIAVASLVNTIDEKIAGFDFDGLMSAANALSGISGELTAEKLLDAYANSDMYKKQHEQDEVQKESPKKSRKRNSSAKAKTNNMKIVDGGKNDAATPVLSPTDEV